MHCTNVSTAILKTKSRLLTTTQVLGLLGARQSGFIVAFGDCKGESNLVLSPAFTQPLLGFWVYYA